MHERYWTPEEDKIIIDAAKNGTPYKTISHLVKNRSNYSISRRVTYLGHCSTWKRSAKYNFDRAYFDTPTPESCYWAGIMQTDGHVNKRGNSMIVKWGCSEKDRAHMELFKSMTRSEQPIKSILKKCQLSTLDTEKEHPFCYICFDSAKPWTDALERHYGITINKTLRSKMPTISTTFLRLCFLRGMIDGDGYITVMTAGTSGTIGICGSNREIIMWVKEVVDSLNLPTLANRPTSVRQYSGESCYYWKISGLSAAVLYELFRRLPTPGLARKWERPDILTIVDYWKSRKDLWPPESFFENIIKS